MTQQMLEWNSSSQYDTGTVSSFDLDDQGNCLQTHVGAGSLYYRVGTINDSDKSINFGNSTRYASGTTTNISLTSGGNFVEVHVSGNNLYSRVAQANFSNKTINWREGRQYDQYDSGTYCDIAVDEQDNCLEVHVSSSGLYYRVGKVNFTAKNIDWTRSGTRFTRGYYRNCSVAIDNQGNCLVTYADKNNRLYSRVGKLNGNTVDWGASSQYAPGYLSSVALDKSGNCIATHVKDNQLYYCLGTLNIDSKTITWGESIRYSEDDGERFSFTNVASDSQGNCFQTHVIPGSPNRLFYRWAKPNRKQEWQRQFGSSDDDIVSLTTVDLEWNSSTQYDTGTVSSFDLDEQGNCLEVHVGSGKYYRVGTINESDKSIDFGDGMYYAWGDVNNISLANEGNFVEVHVSGGKLYAGVAQADFINKTIEWRSDTPFDRYDVGTYCDVAVDEQDNCLEVHINCADLHYRVGKVNYTAKNIDWLNTDSLILAGGYTNCNVTLDNQGNCIATYADYNNCLHYSVGRLNGSTVDWGEGSEYAQGYLSSVALDEAGNCIATYVKEYCLYYRVGTLNSDSKTITWGGNIRYSEDNGEIFIFTNATSDFKGDYFEVHAVAGSPNRLFYRWAKLSEKPEEQPQLLGCADDVANGLAVDLEGNIYATGTTLSQLGSTIYGEADAWVAKFDSEGTQQWIKQLGTNAWDSSKDIATDSEGYVYITGYTCGNLADKDAQESDVWVMKLDAQGNEIWKKQFGSSDHDVSNAVAVDEQGNVYLAGYTLGGFGESKKTSHASAWVGKLDAQGGTIWIKELGTWGWTEASDVALGSDGSIYVTGSTNSNLLALSDAWIAKYDGSGNQKWVKHFCREGESASTAIAIDSQDNIYLAGYIKEGSGELISGWADVCVVKYDSSGGQQWLKSLGGVSEVDDAAHDIAVDNEGNIYVTGHTESTLGATNFGDNDAWVAKFDSDGNVQWTKQIGTAANDYSFAIAVSPEQDVYLAGKTAGDLATTNNGNYDIWLARVNP